MKWLSLLLLLPALANAQAGAPSISPVSTNVDEVMSSDTSKPLAPMSIPGLPVPKPKPTGTPKPTNTAPPKPRTQPLAIEAKPFLEKKYQEPVKPVPAASGSGRSAEQSEAEVLRNLVNTSPNRPKQRLKMPPAEITLRRGVNEQIPIARGAMNRLVTPFANPVAKSADTNITIEYEGPVLYVGTAADEDISLFIQEKGSPYSAFALTLLPSDIPAVSVSLRLAGSGDSVEMMRPSVSAQSQAFETDQPFSDAIKTLFRELALGNIPNGFGMESLNGRYSLMPTCNFGSGIRVIPMQLITGHAMVAVVARLENHTNYPISLDERACQGPGVLSVAMFPRQELAPRQMTELFIALRRPSQAPSTLRPSTIGGRP